MTPTMTYDPESHPYAVLRSEHFARDFAAWLGAQGLSSRVLGTHVWIEGTDAEGHTALLAAFEGKDDGFPRASLARVLDYFQQDGAPFAGTIQVDLVRLRTWLSLPPAFDDTAAMDAIASLAQSNNGDRFSGADFHQDVWNVVRQTGREVEAPAEGDVWTDVAPLEEAPENLELDLGLDDDDEL